MAKRANMPESSEPEAASTLQPIGAPYEPTDSEAKTLEAYTRRKAARPPLPEVVPTVTTSDEGETQALLAVDHPDKGLGYKLLSEATASEHWAFTAAMIELASKIARTPTSVSSGGINYALAFVAGMKPRDQLEAALGMQMAAVHHATMNAVEKLNAATKREMAELHEKALNRLARTFAAQMEALKRYRSKGEQRVYVERVNVSKGGQAIIGNVSHKGRGGGLTQDEH